MRQHEEVRAALEIALARTTGVSGAAYFGSTGADRIDSYSDVDLIVGCNADTAGQFLMELHRLLGIVLFRPFSEDRKPGGRYWFAETNPFVRLDVSFYEDGEFDQILRDGRGYARPPFKLIPLRSVPSELATPDLPGWSRLDHDFAGALRSFHESAKRAARHIDAKRPVDQAEASLAAYGEEPLRSEIWKLYKETLHVLARSA